MIEDWYSIKEKKPRNNEEVLCYEKDEKTKNIKALSFCFFDKEEEEFVPIFVSSPKQVSFTHWVPLPWRFVVRRSPRYGKDKPRKNEIPLSLIPKEEFIRGYLPTHKYLPDRCELVELKQTLNGKGIPGFYTGANWMGIRVRKGETYEYWKFMPEGSDI